MKLKLPCFHRNLQYMEKHVDDKLYKCQCIDCNKIIYRKKAIPDRKHNRSNYLWCDCGNDLIRDSFKGELDTVISDITIYKYVCSDCGEESLWTFDIGMCPIKISTDEQNSIKYL